VLALDERKEVSGLCCVLPVGFLDWMLMGVGCLFCSQLEGIPDSVSEQGMRKGLYQKVSVSVLLWLLFDVLMLVLRSLRFSRTVG
jgi:hypothetical protein